MGRAHPESRRKLGITGGVTFWWDRPQSNLPNKEHLMEPDFAIIGGGIVGLSIAYGLLKRGKRVCVFDEGDNAFRASRGNFGLVWVQSKGINQPAYAVWSRKSAAAYKGFASELKQITGQDVKLVQDGGYVVHMSEETLDSDRKLYEGLRDKLGGDYPFEVMGHNALKSEEPNIGPKVAGALYCREDGHVNPLHLLRSLAAAVRTLGGEVITGTRIANISQSGGRFVLDTADSKRFGVSKVVLAAGLGAMSLGPKLGFKAPVRPQQGQVLITEKLPKLMNRPNVEVRQVNEGGVQIGASKSEVGLIDKEDIQTVAGLARHAVDMFPKLARAKLVRSWAALRIMSPDGIPIYQKSCEFPGAYFVTCHSGITLAAAHSEFLTGWLTGALDAPDLSVFSEARFDV